MKGCKWIEDLEHIHVKFKDTGNRIAADVMNCAKAEAHEELVAKYDEAEIVRGKALNN